MTKKYLYLTFIAVLLLQARINGQTVTYPDPNDSTIIQIKEFYEGYGKVFDLRSINDPQFQNFIKLYSKKAPLKVINLSSEDILLAEKIFFQQYNHVRIQDERSKGYFKPAISVRKKYKFYYRQYLGFEDEKGERYIKIHLLNFKNNRLAIDNFEGWDKHYPISGNGGFYERNIRYAFINLTLQEYFIP